MTVDWYVGTANERRRRQRVAAAQERDLTLLGWLVEGVSVAEMARRTGFSRNHVYELLDRALAWRAERAGPTVEQARALWVDRFERLVEAYMPRAAGIGTNDDGTNRVPDIRAAELLLKVADRLMLVQGVNGPPTKHEIDVFVHKPDDITTARERILAELAAVRDKMRVVDGELAGAGTNLPQLVGERPRDDTPPPPEVTAA